MTETASDSHEVGINKTADLIDSEVTLLRNQVASDLKDRLAEFPDPKKGIKILATMMGIHEKTLKRLLEGLNKPGYQTLLKIYRCLFHTQNDSKLLQLVPSIVQKNMIRGNPNNITMNVNYTLDVERELNRDPIFCEIYFLCAADGVTKEYISYHYGRYGEKILQKMLEQEVIAPISKNKFVLGENQASLGPETLKRIGLHLVDSFSKPENSDLSGENFCAFYAEGLSEEAYDKWIKIDEESFRQKMEITRDPSAKGEIKAYTFLSTDTLTPNKKETRH